MVFCGIFFAKSIVHRFSKTKILEIKFLQFILQKVANCFCERSVLNEIWSVQFSVLFYGPKRP